MAHVLRQSAKTRFTINASNRHIALNPEDTNELVIYPIKRLCDKIYGVRQLGAILLIERDLSSQLTAELRENRRKTSH